MTKESALFDRSVCRPGLNVGSEKGESFLEQSLDCRVGDQERPTRNDIPPFIVNPSRTLTSTTVIKSFFMKWSA